MYSILIIHIQVDADDDDYEENDKYINSAFSSPSLSISDVFIGRQFGQRES